MLHVLRGFEVSDTRDADVEVKMRGVPGQYLRTRPGRWPTFEGLDLQPAAIDALSKVTLSAYFSSSLLLIFI